MRVIDAQTGSVVANGVPVSASQEWRPPAQRFVGLPVARAALRFAQDRHSGQYREIDNAPFIDHPIEVGSLLWWDGQSEEVIAAGLLHDVLEKTATTGEELARCFGTRIVRLVEAVSDDPSIADFECRKRDLRHRVARADPDARAVFAADKIAKVRELGLVPAQRLREPTVGVRLDHYRKSLEMLKAAAAHLGLVQLLDAEFQRVAARAAHSERSGRGAGQALA
jgi:(p)ppGpp synthase/HD superfamily hydrolase